MSVIATNTAANTTLRNLQLAEQAKAKSSEKLSTGLRINRAADDAAGLSISEGLNSQVQGLGQAARNGQDAINVLQTAEGGLSSANDILQRARVLAVQAGTDSNNADSRAAIKTELDSLSDELTRMSTAITFNGITLLDGSKATDGLNFQVGAGSEAATDQINVKITTNLATVAGSLNGVEVDTAENAATAIGTIDGLLKGISTDRSNIGANQNRIEQTLSHVNVTKENLTQAKSTITDVDMAEEMVKFSSANILAQAGTSMLAQANQSGQSVLKLLQ